MSSRYYKATRPDGTDFYTGTVLYEVGRTVTHPAAKKVRNDPATYLSVSTVPTDCTGMRWPCRLFVVEGHDRPMRNDNLPNKRCFSSVAVVEERPAHEVFGPQGVEVVALIARAGRLTADEAEQLNAAKDAAWYAAKDAAWDAKDAAWAAAGDAGDAAWAAAEHAGDAVGAARDAALALVVRDLISPEQFDVLYGPWASVIATKDGER